MEKLTVGVLRILTPLGPRYFRPSFIQRVYLIWLFRHFANLPVKVLSSRQLRLIDSICREHRSAAFSTEGFTDAPLLGTLEQLPPVEPLPAPAQRPLDAARDGVGSFAADLRQRP